MKRLALLGSTGSIGVNTAAIVEANRKKFAITGLAARSNIAELARQIEIFRPKIVSVENRETAKGLRALVGRRVKIVTGAEGVIEVATCADADLVVSAMVGAAGLAPTLAAIESGKNIALANKETMVTAGELVMDRARKKNVSIIPVDSEHSAIFQVMRGEKKKSVVKITLTASGGPFLKLPRKEFSRITPAQALKHPNWKMGPKISIDSATMMNKGLEVIEARWLFNFHHGAIETLVHPESIIHSMVEFSDQSVLAQLSLPDMKTPISYALGYPDRMKLDTKSLDLAALGRLTFKKPDTKKFPCLKLAYEALQEGGSTPATLNAANEIAVEAFLNKRILFTDIPTVVTKTIEKSECVKIASLDDALEADRLARILATAIIKS